MHMLMFSISFLLGSSFFPWLLLFLMPFHSTGAPNPAQSRTGSGPEERPCGRGRKLVNAMPETSNFGGFLLFLLFLAAISGGSVLAVPHSSNFRCRSLMDRLLYIKHSPHSKTSAMGQDGTPS